MLDALKVWWVILTRVGPIGTARHYAEMWIRLFIVEVLQRAGLFDYVREPRNYGQIVAHFGFVDSPYTRDVLDTLVGDKLLLKVGDRYSCNTRRPLPVRKVVKRQTPRKFHHMTMWEDMAQRIPARMRQSPTDFVYRMAQDGRAVFSFDNTLNTDVYALLRKAAFAYIDAQALRGTRMLDVACGSGHETVDIWMWLKGDVQLTAVDPVPGLLDLAKEYFEEEVGAHNRRGVAPLTGANRPSFRQMSAMNLDFPDDSFDVVFHSLLLHWTPDPARAIQEMARVLKPGGLVFGMQITKPLASPYIDLITRVHENVYGYFWEEQFRRWYEKVGVTLSIATPAGVFKGRKRGRQVVPQ
jgi:ubiquinone/menaquinone biosynthesis C-methylase UbiE